jgi:hypothetical protein
VEDEETKRETVATEGSTCNLNDRNRNNGELCNKIITTRQMRTRRLVSDGCQQQNSKEVKGSSRGILQLSVPEFS